MLVTGASRGIGAGLAREFHRAGARVILLALNVLAPMELTRQVLPGMIERGRGHLLATSSLAGTAVLPGLVAYSASKSALTHFMAGVRGELRGLPIGTTVIEVGLIPTDMKDSVLHYAPTAAAFKRFYRLGLLCDTPLERVCRSSVAAVASGKRHVRFPRRARAFPLFSETPRRMAEIILSGVSPR